MKINWKQTIGGFSHHAYALEGGREFQDELLMFLEKEHQIKVKGNPDFFHYHTEVFSIDQARVLKEQSGGKSYSGKKKIFVVACQTMTAEAQNALLKVLEEPPAETHFFLVVPSLYALFPTVRSRMMLFPVEGGEGSAETKTAETFLRKTLPDRFAWIKEIVDDIADEKKSKADVLNFLRTLETVLIKDTKRLRERPQELERVLSAERNLSLSGASVKMLLEDLACALK